MTQKAQMLPSKEIQSALNECLHKAYSPYSTVKVAAAVEYEVNGETKVAYGVNVENVSYGLTICAERSAISNAIIDGMQKIKAAYIISNQEQAISPCGACRQVLTEFMENETGPVVSLTQNQNPHWCSTLGQLLPNRFTLEE